MQIVYARCGGIDVHKKILAVCSIWTDEQGEHIEEAKFGTYTRDLQALAEWFHQRGVRHVAMEERRQTEIGQDAQGQPLAQKQLPSHDRKGSGLAGLFHRSDCQGFVSLSLAGSAFG